MLWRTGRLGSGSKDIGMKGGEVDLTVCATCGPAAAQVATAHWDALGLDQVLFGEWPIGSGLRARLLPDVNTTQDDWPCLEDVLQGSSLHAAGDWLLLLDGDALPSWALITSLRRVLATTPRPQLLFGRAWRVTAQHWQALLGRSAAAANETMIGEALRDDGTLDSPADASWFLFPRHALFGAPPEIAASTEKAGRWLAKRAAVAGWPVLDATALGPLIRPRRPGGQSSQTSPAERIHCTAALVSQPSGAPRISFLLAAGLDQLPGLVDLLSPAPSLPWDVISRPVEDRHSPDAVSSAWTSAFAEARGDLIWPLLEAIPPLASIETLLRCFEAPWVDLVTTAFRIGGLSIPATDPTRRWPGTVVVRREWLDMLGGFPLASTASESLSLLRRSCLARGATLHPLPIELFAV